ncbi:zona pellucida sperm-binding protein 3 [Anolis carolinensis]|uniref:zona pellucida sperm-binding protein 3 n=1 Tax=Anolis carolinensis TaxID=28377 RepID=UPI002F2B2049
MESGVMGLVGLACSLALAVAQRVPSTSVLYECNQTSVHLVLPMDPWGTGMELDPQDLRLGTCPPSSANAQQRLFHFEYRLTECGFARLRSVKMVEYSAYLVHSPLYSQSGLYNRPFTERINCTRYGSEPWVPAQVTSVKGQLLASGGLVFTATFMKEDFRAPSASAAFLLGSQIHLEFGVKASFHQPLRVFVDECVAATSPELSRSLRNYTVIANYGCFVDGKGADSQFLPRRTPGTLRLSLQAFEFLGLHNDVYLHCRISAWDPNILAHPTRKACSFHRDLKRWELLDDLNSPFCQCCDSVCQPPSFRHKRGLKGSPRLASEMGVGQVTVRRRSPNAGHYEWVANSSFALRRRPKGQV